MQAQQLATLIEAYSALGTHRTGSPGDDATSAWLIARLSPGPRSARHAVCIHSRRRQCSARTAQGVRIAGTPLHDGGFTTAAGVTAPLLPIDQCVPSALALVMPGQRVDPHTHPLLRGPGRAAGMVLVSGDPLGQVLLRNAEHMADALVVPVLQVASADAAPLVNAAAQGSAVTLVAAGARRPACASNVVAQRPGHGAPLLLLTPKSGWFHCAAERGSGVAIGLALAEHAAACAASHPAG